MSEVRRRGRVAARGARDRPRAWPSVSVPTVTSSTAAAVFLVPIRRCATSSTVVPSWCARLSAWVSTSNQSSRRAANRDRLVGRHANGRRELDARPQAHTARPPPGAADQQRGDRPLRTWVVTAQREALYARE